MQDSIVGYFFVYLIGHSSALECWTCVGIDCDGPIGDSKFAYKTNCEQGAECQKTYFYYYDFVKNTSERVGPTRSCSYPIGCSPLDEFASGICNNWKFYQSLGCVRRYCCNSDLCNAAVRNYGNRFNTIALCVAAVAWRVLKARFN